MNTSNKPCTSSLCGSRRRRLVTALTRSLLAPLLLTCLPAWAANIAPLGQAILGVNDTIGSDLGIPRTNAGVVGNINDGDPLTRVDNWFGGNADTYSYVGVIWPTKRYDPIVSMNLTLATFSDGGWFGIPGQSPAPGGALLEAQLEVPAIQVTSDGGATWTTVFDYDTDYFFYLAGHTIGGGGNPNPTSVDAPFFLFAPVTRIDGIRLIGRNGGNAGSDPNGFLGVFELIVESGTFTDSDGDGMPDEWEVDNGLTVGVNDAAGDGDVDGLDNLGEYQNGSSPSEADTDGDGLNDGDEVNTHLTLAYSADTDGDGLTDGAEVNSHGSDPLLTDTDTDTISDGDEVNVYGTNPTLQDTDGDGYQDPFEIAQGTDPTDPESFPNNFALNGTGYMGTKPALDTGAEVQLYHAGSPSVINDGNLTTRVDTWNGDQGTVAHTVSFVGILWPEPLDDLVQRMELTFATFLDGGWFGPNASQPAAGQPLQAIHVTEPRVEVTSDGGVTWTVVAHTSDYMSTAVGHPIGGGGQPNPSTFTSSFTLDTPVTGIDGIRIIGTEGGNASGGFLGVFELEVRGEALDADNDGMEDTWERMNGLIVGVNDADEDPDMDDLTNLEEFEVETNPQVADTDGDGLNDGAELNDHGTDPLVADTDVDGLSDGEEVISLGTNPLLADTDGDGTPDGQEVAIGTDPNNPISFPVNLARLGTGLMGTKVALDSGAETNYIQFGAFSDLVDGNFGTRVDTYNGGRPHAADTVSFVGVTWAAPQTEPIDTARVTFATFVDGGWFGVNNSQPAAGQALETTHVVEPRVEITTDGGTTWTVAPHTSDYIGQSVGHRIGGGGQPNPTTFSATFTLNTPAVGINGIRVIGTEGGTASAGFLGVFEFEVINFSSDDDNDNMEDSWERANGLVVGVDDSAEDPDDDGLTNVEEYQEDTLAQVADSDSDGLNDGDEVNTHLTNPLVADSDADGVSDGTEVNVYGSNPLVVDTDADGFRDGYEVASGSDPTNPESFPANIAPLGLGILGVRATPDGGAETLVFNAGVRGNINDTDPLTRVDSYSTTPNTASFVGILFDEIINLPIIEIEFTLATFFDGGWFGPNGTGPGSGGVLAPQYLTEPHVEITTDGGTTWTPIGSTSDYLTVMNGHPLPAVDFGPPTSVTTTFTLSDTQVGINGIRLVGSEGGTASAGFLGVFEFEVNILQSDTDNDGMLDEWERMNGLIVGVNDSGLDPDMDDLTNLGEFEAETNPQVADTDADGLDDGDELNVQGTNPLVADTDGDGVKDGAEVNTHGSNPLVADTDGDGSNDGTEVTVGTEPTDPSNYPINLSRVGTGLLGTKVALDSGAETPRFNSGTAANIVDGNVNTRVDNWNGNVATVTDTVSFVGVSWSILQPEPIVTLRLRHATFGDGGWFGVNNASPGAGQPLGPVHLVAPRVEVTSDGGATWTVVPSTTDYLTVATGHRIGGGGQPNPTTFTSVYNLDAPAGGINGIRIIGTEGGVASGGFLGVFELEAFIVASDVDNDGMEDTWERANGLVVGVDDSGEDPDGDGLTNGEEHDLGTKAQLADSDADGLSDGAEVNTHATNPTRADTEGDGLNDGDEINVYGTDPLVADSDGDGFRDGYEVANGSNPANPNSLPPNVAVSGTGILGTKPTVEAGVETPRFNSGTAANINDDNLNSRVDDWNGNIGSAPDTASFVGIVWPQPLPVSVASLHFEMATFGDGGWFGVNNLGPGAGQPLTSAHLVAPRVEISMDGGATWTPVASTTDYLTSVDGHLIGGGGQPNPSRAVADFVLDVPAAGISGIRLIGTEGGTASGGFLGVFELQVYREIIGILEANDDSATTAEDTPVTIDILANDTAPGGATPAIAEVESPSFGSVAVNPNGTVTYTPAPNYYGPDAFAYTITDGVDIDTATVSLTVTPVNDPPMPVIDVSPLSDLGPDVTGYIVISANNETACVTLDGSGSSDVDNAPGDLTFLWLVDDVPAGTGPVLDVCLLVGARTVSLIADDGTDMGEATVLVDVILASEAVEELILQVDESVVTRKNKQPFFATLKSAMASFDRGSTGAAINNLQNAFQNKVQAQIGKTHPEVAEEWIRIAQEIIDAVLLPQACDCEE